MSEAGLVGLALLVPIAFSPSVYASFWSPKVALLLPAVVPGVVALVRAAAARTPGARWALAFVVWAGVATAWADRPVLSLVGLHAAAVGWLFWVAVAGLWAMGTRAPERVRGWVPVALLAGAGANAVVAWLQAGFELPVDVLDPAGRASGLTGNAVHLGALAAAALWLAGSSMQRFPRAPRPPRPAGAAGRGGLAGSVLLVGAVALLAGAVALLAGAVQLSGTRSALLPALLVGAVWTWRLPGLRRAVFAGAAVAGVGLAALLPGGGQAATERANAAATAATGSARTAVWEGAAHATLGRPVTGWGPARVREATAGEVGIEVTRGGNPEIAYDDAHNLFAEVAVTTGLVGLGLFAAWLWGAARGARGGLAGFAAVVGAVSLLQPLSVVVTAPAALALGLSRRDVGAPSAVSDASTASTGSTATTGSTASTGSSAGTAGSSAGGSGVGRAGRVIGVAGAAAGLVASGVLLAGEVSLARAAIDFSGRDLERAEQLLPPWPVTGFVGWRIEAYGAITERDPSGWDRAARQASRAVRRDPSSSAAWSNLADIELRRGRAEAARRAYAAAVEVNPWSPRGRSGLVHFADRAGDAAAVREHCAVLERVTGERDCLERVREAYGDAPSRVGARAVVR